MTLARIRIEDIQEELSKENWKLISTEYHKLDEILEYQCAEGHYVFAPWKKIRQKRECPVCLKNSFAKPKFEVKPKKKGDIRTLSLDQATKVSGYSIFDNKNLITYGTFQAPEDLDEIARDHVIKEWLISVVKNFDVDFVGLEGIQLQNNFGVTTFETLARLQGILAETCYSLDVSYKICPVATWRNHCGVKGKTRSDRKASARALIKSWYDVTVTEDEADAICIGRYVSEIAYPKVEVFNWE